MEHGLRCNALKCRKELKDRAVVTTCSHIFCLECSNRLELSNPPQGQQPSCPACNVRLSNPDDAVITNLNPTEDYKTSVLSGLSPNIIMECTGRALSFWAYQTTQEIVYQEYLARTLTDKYGALNSQMDTLTNDANVEIGNLRSKLSGMHIDRDTSLRKFDDLQNAYREKCRVLSQTQELYDKLKRRSMLGQVQNAASEAVDHTIQESITGNRFVDQVGSVEQQPQATMFSSHHHQQANNVRQQNIQPPTMRGGDDTRDGYGNRELNRHDFAPPESAHRQRLGPQCVSRTGPSNGIPQGRFSIGTPLPRSRTTPLHGSLQGINGNAAPGTGFAGYGMSAGLKTSVPLLLSRSTSSFERPVTRSRVAQRSRSNIGSHAQFGPESRATNFNGNTYF